MKTYYLLKSYCRNIFLVGAGNFWYDEGPGKDNTFLYRMYSIILFSTYGLLTVLELLAALLGDFPKDEQGDSVAFSVSHTIVMFKFYSVISKKDQIKILNRNMVRICERHEEPVLMEERHRVIRMNVAGYLGAVYGSAVFFVFEGLRKMNAGSHFVTVVTYYPSFEDNSTYGNAFRVFTTIILMLMLMTMILSIDGFTVTYLILYKYKLITLRKYFEGLREEFDKASETGTVQMAADKLANGFVEGIVMHEQLLRLSKDIDQVFGTVLTLQLCQSSGSAVSLLLQVAVSQDLTFAARMKLILFVLALFFLLALFLCNAGEITYQASLLSDSIFYCGWHACPPQPPPRRNLRRLVLQACAQAQRPLVMKAFKMLALTYGTFLLVVRSTYSVFALFYAQNE